MCCFIFVFLDLMICSVARYDIGPTMPLNRQHGPSLEGAKPLGLGRQSTACWLWSFGLCKGSGTLGVSKNQGTHKRPPELWNQPCVRLTSPGHMAAKRPRQDWRTLKKRPKGPHKHKEYTEGSYKPWVFGIPLVLGPGPRILMFMLSSSN